MKANASFSFKKKHKIIPTLSRRRVMLPAKSRSSFYFRSVFAHSVAPWFPYRKVVCYSKRWRCRRSRVVHHRRRSFSPTFLRRGKSGGLGVCTRGFGFGAREHGRAPLARTSRGDVPSKQREEKKKSLVRVRLGRSRVCDTIVWGEGRWLVRR